jgi:hypothetical protein
VLIEVGFCFVGLPPVKLAYVCIFFYMQSVRGLAQTHDKRTPIINIIRQQQHTFNEGFWLGRRRLMRVATLR